MAAKLKRGRTRCRTKLNRRLTFRLHASLLESIQRAAEAERRDVPDFVRLILEDRVAGQATTQQVS